jgi:ribose 5-phosphate isomerase B
MRIALGSDMKNELTDALERLLRERGHETELFGALLSNGNDAWPAVGRGVGEAVASSRCAQGIVCCWTGTGVSIAANKVPGIRAALCSDAATAEGARIWNDANVLAISLRATSIAIAEEIVDAWFRGTPTEDPQYHAMIESIAKT